MSEQETISGSGVVVVDHAPSYRPPAPEESSPARGQRLRAPPVGSMTGIKKKESSYTSIARKGMKSSETPLSRHKIGKITSATAKKPESPNETIAMASLEPDSTIQPDTASPTSHSTKSAAPIPPDVSATTSFPSSPLPAKPVDQGSADVNIESDDVAELRTVMDTEPKHSEWSDEEEAGGLPRSESRASRVSRAVRQLFCCGMPYDAASEDNISSRGFAL